ncbi:MAG: DNA cytosine methyltransferase [Calditerrivibrio sp.]|nr:DNA cytosine methyltransferase [Calditerrivibrio sp.]
MWHEVNVLSLFDGISCGQIALERAGYKIKQYFASEIKPHAIKCTQSNYPNTIQYRRQSLLAELAVNTWSLKFD